MGPKKKGGKSKSKSSGLGGIIDGVDTSQMSREQLEIFAHRIKEENEREREERNYFQLERDKLHNFWEITQNELQETNAKLRNKDRQIEESNEKNEEEVRFFKQKAKLHQFEHQNSLTECKAQSLVALKVAQDEHIAQEDILYREKNDLKQRLREEQTSHLSQIKELKLHFSYKISSIRKDFENRVLESQSKYENRLKKIVDDFNLLHKVELTEVEERKNSQINTLINQQEDAFTELKNYYNDITLNNLALIASLKDQTQILTTENEKIRKELSEVSFENRQLQEPLRKAQSEIIECKKQLEKYKADKMSLCNIKAKYYDLKKVHEKLQWENEALELRFENLQRDHIDLRGKFQEMIMNLQQKSNLKIAALSKQLESLNSAKKCRDEILEEFAVSTNGDSFRLDEKIEELIISKNVKINDLETKLADINKNYNDLYECCKKVFRKHGVKEELNFVDISEISPK